MTIWVVANGYLHSFVKIEPSCAKMPPLSVFAPPKILYPFHRLLSTKRELLSTKSSLFVYPSRRLGIDARKLAIPSLRSLHRHTKCGVYHQHFGLYLISPFGAGSSCGLMVYKAYRFDDIQFLVELMIYTPSA